VDNGASMHIELTKKRRDRIRDYVLYFAITFAFVGVILFVGLSHFDHDKSMKWVFFLFYTLFVFGFLIEQSRALWKLSSFWLLTGLNLLLHCITLAMILAHTPHLKGISWVPGFFEVVFLQRSTQWLLRLTPSPQ
jgi:hypothetical protein